MKICFLYIGSLEKGAFKPGLKPMYQKFTMRSTRILKRIIIRGNEVVPVNIDDCLGSRANPYIGYGLSACGALLKAVRSQVDVFLADYLEAGLLAYVCKKIKKRPFVFDYRDNYTEIAKFGDKLFLRDRYITCLEKTILGFSDHVITTEEDLRQRCLFLGADEDKITIIPNGVDTKMFNPHVDGKDIRQELNLNDPYIVYVGKMESYYRLDVLIKAFSIVSKEAPHLKFLLVGDGTDQPYLKALTKELGISESVIFPGFQPYARILQFIGAANIAVFPHSRGIVIREYMACGKPIVKLRSETTDILEHLKSGFLVKNRKPEEFAKGIIRVFADRKLSTEMGRNARRLAVENYDWERLADRYLEVLKNSMHMR